MSSTHRPVAAPRADFDPKTFRAARTCEVARHAHTDDRRPSTCRPDTLLSDDTGQGDEAV